ncbi:hypothetical protein C0J52_11245 [Blattella germanica]|nr:hypothetical protein C0J52_11245 [Blattella germanica]
MRLQYLVQSILAPILNLVQQFQQKAADLVSGFQGNAQNLLLNITNAFDSLRDRINQALTTLKSKGQSIFTCFTSETQNVSAVIQEGEQEAVTCATNITSQAKPYINNFFNTTKEVIDLATALIPSIVQCASQANPVTTPICLASAILPKLAEITQVAKDVPAEFQNLQEGINVLQPQLQNCGDLFKATANKAGALVQEVETCVKTVISS